MPDIATRAKDLPENARFGKNRRLLTAATYSQVFDNCEARASHRHLLLLARRNQGNHDRLGLVIAKKHVRLAVQRNRIKRLARELVRQLPHATPTLDIILLARKGIAELDNQELSSILQLQWEKLRTQAIKVHAESQTES